MTQECTVILSHWKKGMKIQCPECKKKIKSPYICKCGAVLKPRVKINSIPSYTPPKEEQG